METFFQIRICKGDGEVDEVSIQGPFSIGRSKECDLQIREHSVSRMHAKVEYNGNNWTIKDSGSSNGLFLNGDRIAEALLPEKATVSLGKDGPLLIINRVTDSINSAILSNHKSSDLQVEIASETQIMKRYFSEDAPEDAGEQTMMFRKAFNRAHIKRSRKFFYIIALSIVFLIFACGTILYQKKKLERLKSTAQDIFYVMKSLELQILKLEDLLSTNISPAQFAMLKEKRDKFKGMESEYDRFVNDLGIYAKASEEDRVIMKVARIFGECELAMPKGFTDEVKKYIGIWKSTDRLKLALEKADRSGYTAFIYRALTENGLPPQFFYLALQESNFNEMAIGPLTRFGHAKGMWQFISPTADRYGLRVGPLFDQGVYDPLDERFNYMKATDAAIKYIKELSSTGAQASGLLVMASYNWGEGNVRPIIDKMPENPKDRNFWRLLVMKEIPQETYNYVYSIFSAAVICEEPKMFGYEGICPSF